jgi:hypothetical protein
MLLRQELGNTHNRSISVSLIQCVWGGGGEGNDATELKDEFRERNIDFPFFGRRVT